MARETNAGGGGATGVGVALTGCAAGAIVRNGGATAGTADAVGLAGVVEMDTPSPLPPKGPVISGGRSKCFCVGLRPNVLKFKRARISLSGNTTGSESYSSFTLNSVGAAWRSSPKVIFTTPKANCGVILPIEIEMVALLKSASVRVNRACSCGGRPSKMDRRGKSNSLIFAADAGRSGATGATGRSGGAAVC